MAKIGLSVSLCIADIARGDVAVGEVDKLIAGTRCADEADWNEVIRVYRIEDWIEFPDEAETVLRQLIADDKVEQPRLEDNDHSPRVSASKGTHWVESEDDIVWRDGEE